MSGHEFYDYAAKYTPGLSETVGPGRGHRRRPRPTMHKIARDAYRAIGAEGFARVDFLLAGDAIYLSEINTIPGFTPISLFPTMPAEGGYTFAAVCVRIVELAHRAPRRPRRSPPHPGGPAAMSGRPVAAGPARRCPAAGRGRSAARRPACRAVRAGAALAMLRLGRGDLRRRRVVRLRLHAAPGRRRSTFTDQADVEAAIAGARGENLFRLQTGPLEAALEALPTVDRASVDVRLPGTLAVTVTERAAGPRLAGRRRPLPRRRRRRPVRCGCRPSRRPRPRPCRSSTTGGRRRPA